MFGPIADCMPGHADSVPRETVSLAVSMTITYLKKLGVPLFGEDDIGFQMCFLTLNKQDLTVYYRTRVLLWGVICPFHAMMMMMGYPQT